jgi:hypothetical protein
VDGSGHAPLVCPMTWRHLESEVARSFVLLVSQTVCSVIPFLIPSLFSSGCNF